MGMSSPQVAQPMSPPSGKGPFSQAPTAPQMTSEPELGPDTQMTPQPQQPMGKGGNTTFPSQGGQPRFGKPNTYSNTVGPWDNANIQPRQTQSGKGKGY
jgi:hypothetical protein